MKKIPILLITHNRSLLLEKVIKRVLKYTPWERFDLWILCNYVDNTTKNLVNALINEYKFIKAYYQDFNQISIIQNDIIRQLKSEIYIKLDDDILVTENWTSAFIDVINRHNNISIGSVVIPINGFGWVPFLEIMNLKSEFCKKFPDIHLIQGCTEPAIWSDIEVNNYFWSKCIELDKVAELFNKNQSKFVDYELDQRYSIGAISFTHEFWEKMGGWRVDPDFQKKIKVWNSLKNILRVYQKFSLKKEFNRLPKIIDLLAGVNISSLGVEEEHVYKFSIENGYKQIVTTQNVVFHFSFSTCFEELMKNFYYKIKW